MRRWGGVAVLGVALGCMACGARSPRPSDEPVAPAPDDSAALESVPARGVGGVLTLRFAWPDGLTGRCRTRRRVGGAGPAEPEKETSFRVRVQHAPDEIRIVNDDLSTGASPLTEIVERDGRYRTSGHAGETDAALAQTWKLLVGAWAGRELPLGATYSATAPESMPGGGTVRVRIAIQADGRVPCRPSAPTADCVRLRLYSEPEERVSPGLVATLLALVAPESGIRAQAFVPRIASIATSAVVVTEPDTLIPHRFTLRRRYVLAGTAPEEPDFARERGEEITRVCAWR